MKQPRREEDLQEIVDYEDVLELKGFPVLHYLGPQDLDDVHVGEADDERRERRAH